MNSIRPVKTAIVGCGGISDIFFKNFSERFEIIDLVCCCSRGRASAEKKAATIDAIDLLEEFGISLGMPHARPLSDGIWKLRARASDGLTRVLFFSPSKERRAVVLLHGVEKDQRTISDTDRKTALKRKKAYEGRPQT